MRAATVAATALLAAAYGGGSIAGASPVPGCGHLYWTNGYWIGRANLNGTDVNQKFITGASLPTGVTVAGGYIYWANNSIGTIGRARINGTDVNERFIIVKPTKSRLGLFGLALDHGQ